MKRLKFSVGTLLIAFGALLSQSASAQWGLGAIAANNMAFDQRMAATLNGYMQQNQRAIQNIRQQHLQQNLPRLQAQYAQLIASGQRGISFEQFVHWDLMTAAGTNVQGGLDAQRRQFEGWQRANATIQSGHASYNAAWHQNQAVMSAAMSRYSEQAIRGNAPYVDPRTGATTQLPYHLSPGQTYTTNGVTYAQDAQGTYYANYGNGWWTRMQPAR
ncbi:MAG TPA: hypothetical protein PKA20_17785 [Burkholderiaceae bacterium]|nr:hypothetical protein [Burkholderiaceae bacterium]